MKDNFEDEKMEINGKDISEIIADST